MARAGRDLRVYVSTDGVDANKHLVEGIKSVTQSLSGGTIDVSEFGVEWVRRISGLRDGTYSLEGHYEQGTAGQGQALIRSSYLAGTALWVHIVIDTSTGLGIKQKTFVSNYELTAATESAVEVSFDLEGTDAAVETP